MKARIKVILGSLTLGALVGITLVYLEPSLFESYNAWGVPLPKILIITIIETAAFGLLLARIFLHPLRKLSKASRQIAKGNFAFQIYHGKINKDKIRNTDELGQLVIAFETLRRKVIALDTNLDQLIKEKTLDLERVNDELIEKEKALQRINAKLTGHGDELKTINEELQSKVLELSEANEKLEKLDQMKNDFIQIAAHELRTPIQPLLGFIELAEKGLVTIDEAWKVISLEAKRVSVLATDMLAVSQIETGTFTYEMKPITISQLVDSITSSSSKFATEDGVISIRKELDADVKILGDLERLNQAFANLINNSVKFAKDGTIRIQTRNNNDLVEISIVDDGPGIPSEIMPILFNKFVTKTEANKRGTGLGLFIARAIFEAHNGTITAQNNSESGGKGATFKVSLPIHKKYESPVAAA